PSGISRLIADAYHRDHFADQHHRGPAAQRRMNPKASPRLTREMSMWKRRTFAKILAAFALAPLQVFARGAAPTGERLGLKGYDPVAYFTDGKAQPGAPEFEYGWDGVKYRFASAAHRDI